MKARKLAIDGAIEFTPTVFPDKRGLFASPLQEPAFSEAVGAPFQLARTIHSTSHRGVMRGIHFTTTPPGCAKYIHCARGKALDFVVDTRVGSPTFGQWDVVELDEVSVRAVYLAPGLGHAFIAMADDTIMSYLCSAVYVPSEELSVNPLDPEVGLPVPDGIEPIRSERDTVAPTLAEALAQRLLPDYEFCQRNFPMP
ncbi:dTDP-4-dehydrorhamnose 3,5-epimerase family protein [Kutzneria sp. CA-103260]|uniref:dTDP-4-dehydrorhamnose 3,5-epimerase family protein n=1 Tax=Kutzneria sp. CA-103260 TaxID=2802641 RepID=UPI001BA4BCD3|nr:dTDP-4-dehydrorhamnose 3,5-epimerase [Kutzneria sp. CA-103260]QUQ72361.1 dTDP-4-keto-6-deoxy-D-glucose epimerase [Kutzneria sp. CA-103260]